MGKIRIDVDDETGRMAVTRTRDRKGKLTGSERRAPKKKRHGRRRRASERRREEM